MADWETYHTRFIAENVVFTPENISWLKRLSQRLTAEWQMTVEPDDFAQMVTVKALQNILTVKFPLDGEDTAPARKWLKTIAVNLRTDVYRQNRARPETVTDIVPDTPATQTLEETVLGWLAVRDAIDTLVAAGFTDVDAVNVVQYWTHPKTVILTDVDERGAVYGQRKLARARKILAGRP